MKITFSEFFIGFLVLAAGGEQNAEAASATANATQVVIAAISIVKSNDLNFGTAPQGDSAKVISPGDATAASFIVTGDPNRSYTISIPSSNIVMQTSGGGAANKEIVVSNFSSNPNGTGTIGSSGVQTLKVGASRSAILANQLPGNYSATFTVSVVY